jgi:hypothetical protein
MGLRQIDKALSCCAVADSYHPGQVATAFIHFKLMLMQGASSEEILQVVHSMTTCHDFEADMLCVSASSACSKTTKNQPCHAAASDPSRVTSFPYPF